MALDDLGLEINFRTLAVAAYWIERHCIVPDGFRRGERFGLVRWQADAILNWYRLRDDARVGQLSTAFEWRRAQIVLPQKAGKAPYTSAHICVEAVGPALFAGWARGGETWDCRDHGCGCGWVYEYLPGEAMGQPWPTPLIQITATAEDQTDNIYSALRPMIDDGPLHDLIPRTGESFIRLPGNGRIDTVTSSATSRLGQRVSFVAQDETGIWTQTNGMRAVAETQRRGLSGMQGRAEETTNAWDPNVGSVAQRTAEAAAKTGDIFRIHPLAPAGLSYKNKEERRKIHRFVYEDCPWIDPDAIEGEAAELITVDPGQAERFFGNRIVAGAGVAFDVEQWAGLRAPRSVPTGAVVVLGVDGALHDDALAVVATEVKSGYQWVVDVQERPDNAADDYQHDQHRVDGAVSEVFERFTVWRLYGDTQYIDTLINSWSNRFGRRRVVEWLTYRPRPIAWAVRNFTEAQGRGEVSHDGNEVFGRHIANSRKRLLPVLDDLERPMWTLSKENAKSSLKIDLAMAAVLSWEARSDCIQAGGERMDDIPALPSGPEPYRWEPGSAPPLSSLVQAADVPPLGSMS